MPESTERHLLRTLQQGVLVLTITTPRLQGDRLARILDHEFEEIADDPKTKNIIIDCQHVQSLSSTFFRPLLGLRRKLEGKGGRLVLCNLSPVVADSFRATRLVSTSRVSSSSTFDVQADIAAALASLGSPVIEN